MLSCGALPGGDFGATASRRRSGSVACSVVFFVVSACVVAAALAVLPDPVSVPAASAYLSAAFLAIEWLLRSRVTETVVVTKGGAGAAAAARGRRAGVMELPSERVTGLSLFEGRRPDGTPVLMVALVMDDRDLPVVLFEKFSVAPDDAMNLYNGLLQYLLYE
eukprot:m51a1_g6757 hypothetical protein (163) ;mRNA; f:86092-86703